MFYAKSNVSQKLDVYSALLDRAIDEGDNSNYRVFFTNAFIDAHDLANDSKTFLEVDTNIYDFVYILFKSNSEYFKHLDKSKIREKKFQDEVFKTVKEFIGTLRQGNNIVLNG
jgi:hypothetical protein